MFSGDEIQKTIESQAIPFSEDIVLVDMMGYEL